MQTIRTPKGKLIHAARSVPMWLGESAYSAEVFCGKEFTGILGEVESLDGITCPRCAAAARDHVPVIEPEPSVIGSPEAVREPSARIAAMTPGRYRHGQERLRRAYRRHMMKEAASRG